MGFFHTNNQSSKPPTSPGCLTIECSSGTKDMELASARRLKDWVPQGCPHQRPAASPGCPGDPHFCLPWLQSQGFPQPAPFRYDHLQRGSQSSRRYSILRVYSGRCKWTAGWRGVPGKVQKDPKHRSFFSHGVGVCYPPGMWICSPAWKLSAPLYSRVFIEPSLQLPFPFPKVGRGWFPVTWSFQGPTQPEAT